LEVVDVSGKGMERRAGELLSKMETPKEIGLTMEQDSAEVDGMKFVSTTATREGVKSGGYSIGFETGQTQYVFMANQDKNGKLSVALNIIEYLERGDEKTKAHLRSYSLVDDKVTKVMDASYVVPTRKFASDKEKRDWIFERGFKDLTIEPA
jgi:hypothetical protein